MILELLVYREELTEFVCKLQAQICDSTLAPEQMHLLLGKPLTELNFITVGTTVTGVIRGSREVLL